jgi:hypothetical protein
MPPNGRANLAFITPVLAAVVGLVLLVIGLVAGISWAAITGAVICAPFVLAYLVFAWAVKRVGRTA